MKTLALACVVMVGCVDDLSFGSIEQGVLGEPGSNGTGGTCPVWGCGSNTSKIEQVPFTELEETGAQFNDQGWRILRFEKNNGTGWQSYTAHVNRAGLAGLDPVTGAYAFGGSTAIGARFLVENRNTGLRYYLRVTDVDSMWMWAQPDRLKPRWTYTYRLGWVYAPSPSMPRPPAMHAVDICGANPDNDGMADFYAVLFENDRIDPEAIAVVGETPGWFNIGCAGHALAKQHLLGHTVAAAKLLGVYPPTIPQRTANLKMITADYCGNGHPFTVPGQPLRWRDENLWYDTIPSVGGMIEARWTETGAACLNTPRVDYVWTFLGYQTFPDGVEAVLPPNDLTWCTTRPPPCTGSKYDVAGTHLISVNL